MHLDDAIGLLSGEFAGKSQTYIMGILEKIAHEGGEEARKAIELIGVISQA